MRIHRSREYTSCILIIANVLLFFYIVNFELVSKEVSKFEDANTLIDRRDFYYLIPQPQCSFKWSDQHKIELPFFIILVHSEPKNVEERTMIRSTWAHTDDRVLTYFLMGAAKSTIVQRKIEIENTEYGDIIQGNIIDHLRNDSYKHVMGLKWFTYNCANAKYLVQTKDNVFINVQNVFKFLMGNNDTTEFLLGKRVPPSKTPRNGSDACTEAEYKPEYLPSHAQKFAVIYSNDVAIDLYRKARKSFYFWMEPVLITGILRYQLNVNITEIQSKYMEMAKDVESLKVATGRLPKQHFLFTEPLSSPGDHKLLWERSEWDRMNINIDQKAWYNSN